MRYKIFYVYFLFLCSHVTDLRLILSPYMHCPSDSPLLILDLTRRGPCLLIYGRELQSAARSAVLSPEFHGGSCTRQRVGRNLEHIKQPAGWRFWTEKLEKEGVG